MRVSAGTRLGPYEIVDALGAGGMGEVYRARDTTLDRVVAIKILPESFAHDPERLARFEREAKILAALNHPNIATIHGFEQTGSIKGLVMELVEGPTLAERIVQGPVSLPEALPIAKQIAEALESAHEQGIIHRDLKPGNIKLRLDGTVKVLDFGLAKALAPESTRSTVADLSNSPTIATPSATHFGVLLGTAAYMAPEQAVGKPVDRRADIWSFGVVVFELLTGKPLYSGETASHTIARVIERDPDFAALPAATPAPVHELMRRCLTKDPRTRLQAIGEARIAIERAITDRTDPIARDHSRWNGARNVALVRIPSWQRWLPWTIAAICATALGVVLIQWAPWKPCHRRPRSIFAPTLARISRSRQTSARLAHRSPWRRTVHFSPSLENALVWSNCSFVASDNCKQPRSRGPRVHAGTPSVFLQTPSNETSPMFSPDGKWIAYLSNESGRFDVYVRPFPGPGGKWLISPAGGITPRWSPVRRELFYLDRENRIMAVPYAVEGDVFKADKPRVWSEQQVQPLSGGAFDLHPDGKRFVVAIEPQASAPRDKVVFVLNFFEELRRVADPRP